MILAADEDGGIGFKNGLPWPHISEDMHHFKNITTDQVVVMGANTWNSLGRIAPLKGRTNYVVTSKDISCFAGAFDCYDYTQYDIETIIDAIDFRHPGKDIIIIGGKTLYDASYKFVDCVHLTKVMDKYKCDTFVDTDMYTTGMERRYERFVGGNQHTPDCYIERWVKPTNVTEE